MKDVIKMEKHTLSYIGKSMCHKLNYKVNVNQNTLKIITQRLIFKVHERLNL